MGSARYYILLFVGMAMLFVALVFAPLILLTPVFYVGMAVIVILVLYRGITRRRDEKGGS